MLLSSSDRMPAIDEDTVIERLQEIERVCDRTRWRLGSIEAIISGWQQFDSRRMFCHDALNNCLIETRKILRQITQTGRSWKIQKHREIAILQVEIHQRD